MFYTSKLFTLIHAFSRFLFKEEGYPIASWSH